MKKNKPRAWLAYPESPDQPVYFLDREEQLIGRGEGCHIIVDDRYISRRQAKIYWKTGLLILEDYGRNPILLNGEPFREVMLKDGDILILGSAQFVVRILEDRKIRTIPGNDVYKSNYATTSSDTGYRLEGAVAVSKKTRTEKNSIFYTFLAVILALLVLFVVLYGGYVVYKKILVPFKKRHRPAVEEPLKNSYFQRTKYFSLS